MAKLVGYYVLFCFISDSSLVCIWTTEPVTQQKQELKLSQRSLAISKCDEKHTVKGIREN